jgi:hypothetical protein
MLVLIYPTTRVMILVFALVYLVTRKHIFYSNFQFFIVSPVRMHYEPVPIAAIRISHSVP